MNNEFLKIAIRAVESSGKILIEYFERLHDFKQKNKNIRDLVTEVDILSENNIKTVIRAIAYEIKILNRYLLLLFVKNT